MINSRWVARPGVASNLIVVILLGAALVAKATQAAAQAPDPEMLKKGEYLARLGDCTACHTVAGGKPFAGGLVLATPFGGIPVPNITRDKATGIGNWSDDNFLSRHARRRQARWNLSLSSVSVPLVHEGDAG